MLKIGVLASHEGTTLQSILDAGAAQRIRGRVVAVISNNGNARALSRASAVGIPAHHLSSVTHPAPGELDAAICDALVSAGADIVFLAGYLKRLGPATLAAFSGRVLNTHPALLPKFGGQGMFGDRVYEAVLDAEETESGVSVHLVDETYDTGEVVRQVRVPVEPKDCVESLKARVREREGDLVVETLADIAAGELRLGEAGARGI